MKIEELADFKNSPIVQRHLDIAINLDEACFDKKIPAWLADLADQGDYTEHDIRQFWLFRIEDSEGIPKPKARLYQIPRLLHKSNGEAVKGIEIVPAIENGTQMLRFMQWRPDEEVTRFEALQCEVKQWLPRFCEEFEIHQLGGITLQYVNDIGNERHSKLWPNNSLSLKDVLSFLPAPNAQFGSYVHPFKAETVQTVDREKKIHFKSAFNSTEKSFHVIFEYSSLNGGEKHSIEEVFTEMNSAHAMILHQFAEQFSKSALDYFKG